jgi:hypothetical protein
MPRRVASTCRRRRPGGICGPREHAPRPFSSPSSSASPYLPHFSSLVLHLSLAPHRALALPTPLPSPPVKLAASGPPSPTIARTLFCLTLRHPVLASGSPFEQGRASLSGFAVIGHGAAALDLAVGRASLVLLTPLESSSRVRHPLADPVRAPPCPVVADNGRRPAAALQWRLERQCGLAVSPRPFVGPVRFRGLAQ